MIETWNIKVNKIFSSKKNEKLVKCDKLRLYKIAYKSTMNKYIDEKNT